MTGKRQHANLWGQAVGELNIKTTDVSCEAIQNEDGTVTMSVDIKPTTKIGTIPADASIHLTVQNRLRIQRFTCGTRDAPTEPLDSETGTNQLDAFTEQEELYEAAKWSLKFVDAETLGRTWAWTKSKRLVSKPTTLSDDYGHALLKIAPDHDGVLGDQPYSVVFDEEHPTILINNAADTLYEKLESRNEISVLIMPQVCAMVIDQLILEHLTEPVSMEEDSWKGRWYKWAHTRINTSLPEDDGEIEPYELFEECRSWKNQLLSWLNSKLDAASEVEKYLTEDRQ